MLAERSLLCAARSDGESEGNDNHSEDDQEKEFSPSQIVHGKHEVVHMDFI
jgi:hypothetical protein